MILSAVGFLNTHHGTIKDDFEAIFSDDTMDFKGSFSFPRTYQTAPNPTIHVEGLGHLGIPMRNQTAQILKTHCQLAPFGNSERTMIDESVRGTWEIDSSKVCISLSLAEVCLIVSKLRFDSVAFMAWLDGEMTEVCRILSINQAMSQPRCELNKLLLYETGSQ